jgi:hypothetical protein
MRQQVHTLLVEEGWEDEGGFEPAYAEDDFDMLVREDELEIHYMVFDRRQGDKTAPFERWAPKATRGQPDRRMAQLRGMVPDNIIGQHALTHVDHKPEFATNYLRNYWDGFGSYEEYLAHHHAERKKKFDKLVAQMRSTLYEVIAAGLHGHFNEHVRQVRPCYGIHDIDAYFAACFKTGSFNLVCDYLDAWIKGGYEGIKEYVGQPRDLLWQRPPSWQTTYGWAASGWHEPASYDYRSGRKPRPQLTEEEFTKILADNKRKRRAEEAAKGARCSFDQKTLLATKNTTDER